MNFIKNCFPDISRIPLYSKFLAREDDIRYHSYNNKKNKYLGFNLTSNT